MIYAPELLDRLGVLAPQSWEGIVFRHTFGSYLVDRENTVGARWNPAGVPAIYTSLAFETAKAEVDYRIALQPLRPSAERRMHRLQVRLSKVLDLTDWALLGDLGVDKGSYGEIEPDKCKEVGGAAAELLHLDGIVVPSARCAGNNLVIYPTNQGDDYEFTDIDFEVIE